MATDNYARCLKAVLVFEGGKVDHPADPGGRTNQGVIQRVYDGWRKRNKKPKRDVYLMEIKERDAIYREQYWNVIRGDEMPVGIDMVVFDGAVNSGPGQSVKWLQRALGLKADGDLGNATMAAIIAHKDHKALIGSILDRRMAFLKALRTWPTFGKGWSSRLRQVKSIALAMAGRGGAVFTPETSPGADAKAPVSDAAPNPTKAPADAATGAGGTGLGGAVVLNETKEALEPLAGTSSTINWIIAGLVLISAALVIGGLGYRWWLKRRAEQHAEALDLPPAVVTT